MDASSCAFFFMQCHSRMFEMNLTFDISVPNGLELVACIKGFPSVRPCKINPRLYESNDEISAHRNPKLPKADHFMSLSIDFVNSTENYFTEPQRTAEFYVLSC